MASACHRGGKGAPRDAWLASGRGSDLGMPAGGCQVSEEAGGKGPGCEGRKASSSAPGLKVQKPLHPSPGTRRSPVEAAGTGLGRGTEAPAPETAHSQEHVNGMREERWSGLLLWVKPVEGRPEEGEEDTRSGRTFPPLPGFFGPWESDRGVSGPRLTYSFPKETRGA